MVGMQFGFPIILCCQSAPFRVVSIVTHLGVVVINDGPTDHVGTGRKVHNGWCHSRRLAATWRTTTTTTDGKVDSCRIICDTITLGAEVLDIAEDLIRSRIWVEGCNALMLDVL